MTDLVSEGMEEEGPSSPACIMKWAGGKRQLLYRLVPLVPLSFGVYHEPFFGGGALFFELRRLASQQRSALMRSVLSDANQRLITTYTATRDQLPALLRELTELAQRSDRDAFTAARQEYNRGIQPVRGTISLLRSAEAPPSDVRVAALTLYLNRVCVNGLFRVNSRGEFSTSWGKAEKRPEQIVRRDVLVQASSHLQQAELVCQDFRSALSRCKPGDFVYLDPPYWPVSETADFTGYIGEFGPAEQRALKAMCDRLTAKGVRWLQSNSDAPEVRDLYADYVIDRVSAKRSINRDASGRGYVDELLIRNYEL